MTSDETSNEGGGGVLAGLLAPLRLPERVLDALDQLRPLRSELMRVREQTEPLAGLLPALQRLEDVLGTRLEAVHDTTAEVGAKVGALSEVLAPVDDRLATLERSVQDLAKEVAAIHETLVGVKDDIQRTTGLRGERGVMERARDALTGGSDENDRAGA